MSAQIWEFLGSPLPPVQVCPHSVDHPPSPPPPPLTAPPLPSPCPCGHKAGIIWNIATCEQFILKEKKLIILILDVHTCVLLLDNFDNSIPKDGVTLRSIHSLLNTSRMKILYTDILPNYLSKFHKYGSYNFFSKQTST